MKTSIQIIRPEDMETYQPDLHANTVNRRLLRTGHLEIVMGMNGRDGGAEEHAREKNEQFIYRLHGKGRVQIDGRNFIVGFRSLVYFPKSVPHGGESFVESEGPAKFLVIYSPPIQQYP